MYAHASMRHLFSMSPPNVLAFSCERTAMNSDPTIKSRAFVCCNGGLGGGATMVRKWKHRC
jgi:hypothetical protein